MNAATGLTLVSMFATTLMEWFARFPALWVAVGIVVGAITTSLAAIIVFRKYGDQLTGANDKLVGIQEKQLGMMERTMKLQKDHYEQELEECKKEREEYKNTLHAKREEWQADSTKMQLAIQDLESRPDMRVLNTTLQDVVSLIQKVADSLEKVSDNLDKHDKSIDVRMQTFLKQITAVIKGGRRHV